MDAVNSETMKQYFALLSDVMTEHGLHSNPSNVDETGIPFDPRPPNVVTTKGTKSPLPTARLDGESHCCRVC